MACPFKAPEAKVYKLLLPKQKENDKDEYKISEIAFSRQFVSWISPKYASKKSDTFSAKLSLGIGEMGPRIIGSKLKYNFFAPKLI